MAAMLREDLARGAVERIAGRYRLTPEFEARYGWAFRALDGWPG